MIHFYEGDFGVMVQKNEGVLMHDWHAIPYLMILPPKY